MTVSWLRSLPDLCEVGLPALPPVDDPAHRMMQSRGMRIHVPPDEGFWGQSVAEFALGLTICGLRRIPQLHHDMLTSHSPWDYSPPGGVGRPGVRGIQFGDDPQMANGTVAGKRVRIAGMGNVGGRYAAFCRCLGAEVAAWDPMAAPETFARSSTRQVGQLADLVGDADIFAPMLPLREATRGLIDAALINSLPVGALVVLVTRMAVCDAGALRQRVLNDEIALASDVFDVEPLPLDDPLLGRHNVVHTPHNAGRTVHANHAMVESILDQFTSAAAS